MGTRASSASTALSEDKVTTWSDMIYSSIVEDKSQDDIITQEDLLSYEIGAITEIKQLMPVIQRLTSECLFKPVDTQSGLCWKWRSRSDAKKVALINSNETRMVYDRIEDAGADGIWTRIIKARTGLHDTVMKHAIKHLEQNGYITEFKSVEHPHKKLYIISSLRPSEKATGGPWYHDNDLDEGFIAGITKAVFQLVVTLSSYLPSSAAKNQHRGKNPSRGTISGSDPASSSARGKKRAASAMTEPSAQPESYSGPKVTYLRPLPAGYTKYPTTREIAQRVALSNIVKDITLSEGDIQQIVDALVFDGRIEPVRLSSGRRTGAPKMGYRVTRPARLEAAPEDENDVLLGNAQEEHVTGMAEIPCGGCPVFEVCQEGNAVSPSSCEYYAKWLENLGG